MKLAGQRRHHLVLTALLSLRRVHQHDDELGSVFTLKNRRKIRRARVNPVTGHRSPA